MKDLLPADRPREKLRRLGVSALGDNELVALVLGSGSSRAGALEIANAVLRTRGGLHGLARTSEVELGRVEGIGFAKATRIVAALELGRRTLTHAPGARVPLRTAADAARYLLPTFGARAVEHFGIVLLDSQHRVMKTIVLAIGSLNATVVQPRDVFREAMLGEAAAIVAFHNHPSGDPAPSPEDGELTARLVAAGVLMGIDVIDHVILGDVRYYSYQEIGRL